MKYDCNEYGEWVTIFLKDNKRIIITKEEETIIFNLIEDNINPPRERQIITLNIIEDNPIFIPLINLIDNNQTIEDDINGNHVNFNLHDNILFVEAIGKGNLYTNPFSSVVIRKNRDNKYLAFFDNIKTIVLENKTYVREKILDN